MGWLVPLAMAGIAAYGALVGGLYLAQRRLLYHPGHEVPELALADATDMAVVRLETDDGLGLLAWYKPAAAGRPTILHLHGNAGHIGHRVGKMRPALDAGYGLLLVEYRGFAGNPGTPTEAGLYADGRAGLRFLAERGVGPGATVVYGESLGTGVATKLATEAPVAALVLEAPFTAITDVAQSMYPFVPVRRLLLDRFDSAARIGAITCPLLVLHGENDRTVPIRFGRALFAAANEPKTAWWRTGAGHDDLYDHGAADALLRFLSTTFPFAD